MKSLVIGGGSMLEMDDYFKIDVSTDKMQAHLIQIKERNEEDQLTRDELEEWLKEYGVTHGLIEESLLLLISGETVTSPLKVASGRPAVNGNHAYLKALFHSHETTNDDGLGPVNLRDVIDIESVTSGEKIACKIAATDGVNGVNIFGEELKAVPGRDFVLRKGKNTRVDETGQAVYSLINGQVSMSEKQVHVYPIFEVKGDVDMKVGNITFVGNVIINGNVPTGFSVQADGDIRVRGTVEGARLLAGGSIYVGAGIVGQHKSFLKAGQDIQTTFINQGEVEADGTIEVTQAILHSSSIAGRSIICTKGKGNIVGGTVSAGEEIRAKTIGNAMQTKTLLYIGMNARLMNKQKAAESNQKKAQDELVKLGKLLKVYMDKHKTKALTGKEKILMLRVQHSFRAAKELLDQSTDELESYGVSEERQRHGAVYVQQTIYPNVDIHFGKYRRKLVAPHQYARISLIDREITIASL